MSLSDPVGLLAFVYYDTLNNRCPKFYEVEKVDTKTGNVKTYQVKTGSEILSVFAMFPQTWPNTAMGFGGIAGHMFTSAYVTVLCCDISGYYVYFGHSFAYKIEKPNSLFVDHISSHKMLDVSMHKKYEEKNP
jgi:hypothetical protein